MKKNYTHSKKFSEPVAQETQGAIHVGLNSAHRQLQLLCNVAVAHSVEITHTEHLPALLRQQIDGVVYHAAQVGIFHLAHRVVRSTAVEFHAFAVYVVYRCEASCIHVAALQRVERPCVHGTIKKRVDFVAQIYLVPTFPQFDKNLFHHVVGIAFVGKQAERVEVKFRVSPAEDRVKHYTFVFTHVLILFMGCKNFANI